MKKIISAVAAISVMIALATSAFAADIAEHPKFALIDGVQNVDQTITYDPADTDGFVFSIKASTTNLYAPFFLADVSNLETNGWQITSETIYYDGEAYDGFYADQTTQSEYENSIIQATHEGKISDGRNLFIFRVKPDDDANTELKSATFSVWGTANTKSGMSQAVEEFVVKRESPVIFKVNVGSDAKVGTEDLTQNSGDNIGESNKITYMGVAGEVDITATSTVDVTCTVEGKAPVTRTFNNLLDALFGGVVDGKGKVKANKINFAVIYNSADFDAGVTPTFTFKLN